MCRVGDSDGSTGRTGMGVGAVGICAASSREGPGLEIRERRCSSPHSLSPVLVLCYIAFSVLLSPFHLVFCLPFPTVFDICEGSVLLSGG